MFSGLRVSSIFQFRTSLKTINILEFFSVQFELRTFKRKGPEIPIFHTNVVIVIGAVNLLKIYQLLLPKFFG